MRLVIIDKWVQFEDQSYLKDLQSFHELFAGSQNRNHL